MYKKIFLSFVFLIISDTSHSKSLIDIKNEENLIALTDKNGIFEKTTGF